MRNLFRFAIFLIFVAIIIFGIVLIYSYFTRNNDKSKILAINKDGQFVSSEFKIGNSDILKIKNNDDKNHTVKISGSDKTLVELDSNTTSKTIDFSDNSKTELYLASNSKQKTNIRVGTPKTTTESSTNQTQNQTATNVQGISTSNPLPNTGPGDSYLLSLLALVGLILVLVSNYFWRRFIH